MKTASPAKPTPRCVHCGAGMYISSHEPARPFCLHCGMSRDASREQVMAGFWLLGALLMIAMLAIGLSLTGCTMSIGANGKPVVGIDPVAVSQAIAQWQAQHGAKGATVVIIDPVTGKTLPALPAPSPAQ